MWRNRKYTSKALLQTKEQWLFQGKACAHQFELHIDLVTFFMEHNFYMTELLTDPWFFRLEYLAASFSKMYKVSSSLQENHWQYFVSNNKIPAFKQTIEFWKIVLIIFIYIQYQFFSSQRRFVKLVVSVYVISWLSKELTFESSLSTAHRAR